jgi:ADP-heptose:LPS heptosyltransferase
MTPLEARRILVVKLSALGDVIQALAPLKAIRAAHPKAEITWLTTPPFAELARLCPFVDTVWTGGRPRGPAAWLSLIAQVRAGRFDLVYDLQGVARTSLLHAALGPRPPLWSGPARGASHRTPDPKRWAVHTRDRFAAQLRQTGALGEGEAIAPDLSWVRARLGDPPEIQPAHFGLAEPYALLVPGASAAHGGAKKWPVAHFAAVAAVLAARGLRPAVIGGPAESGLAAAIRAEVSAALDLTGRTDLFALIALAERAALAIGNDTGPMHIAAAAGAPSVMLFAGFSDPARFAPRGAHVRPLQAARLADLEVDPVLEAAARLWAPLKAS